MAYTTCNPDEIKPDREAETEEGNLPIECWSDDPSDGDDTCPIATECRQARIVLQYQKITLDTTRKVFAEILKDNRAFRREKAVWISDHNRHVETIKILKEAGDASRDIISEQKSLIAEHEKRIESAERKIGALVPALEEQLANIRAYVGLACIFDKRIDVQKAKSALNLAKRK